MSVAYFEKSLLEHLGEQARGSFIPLGLSNDDIIQTDNNGNLVSFIKIIGDFDKTKCTEVITETEANTRLKALYKPTYEITNPNVMSATMTALISNGTINVAEMKPEWTDQQENEWLYNKGVSGITKNMPDRFFVEV